ncbi:MAG: hypothetical protein HY291_23395 [Planctomycetes bacterium]|nr:hypothetical protein [Planctomycetota bacterium]
MSLTISAGKQSAPFDLWRPGQLFTGPLIAMDTETEPIRDGAIPRLVLAAATDGQEGYFIARQDLAKFFAAHHDATWLFHHAAFDIPVLAQAGCDLHPLIEAGKIFDTALLYRLQKLADTGTCHGAWSLDHVAHEFLGLVLPKDVKAPDGQNVRTTFNRFIRPDGSVDYASMLRHEHRVYLTYAGGDPLTTFLIAQALNHAAQKLFQCRLLDIFNRETYEHAGTRDGVALGPAWQRFGFLTHDLQLKASLALAALERNGMALDEDRVLASVKDLDASIQACLSQLSSEFGWAPGKGSQQKLTRILAQVERELNESLPRTATGEFSRSAEEIEEFAGRSKFIKLYLRYEELHKLRAVFMDPLSRAENRVRGRFNLLVNTGRTSCGGRRDEDGERTGLNLQNLPRDGDVRNCFVASPGYLLFACDYSTIELVTLAQHTLRKFGWSRMAEAIKRNADLHCVYAARRLGLPIEHLPSWDKKTLLPLLGPNGEKLRDNAKPANFGYPGGLGAESFVDFARTAYGVELTVEQAKEEKDRWLEAWPEMKLHLASDDLQRLANRFSFIWETHPGVYRPFPEGDVPWPVHILRGVLLGRTHTLTKNRPYTQQEIAWAWEAAAIVVEQSDHISPSQRSTLLTRIRERIAGSDFWGLLAPRQRFVATLTGRLRGYPTYCAARNAVFQGLAADGAKLALYGLYMEGFRIVNFIHDEILIEFPTDADHLALAKRVVEIMISAMREVVPDLPVSCEYALMRRWFKGAKALIRDGRLMPVMPVKDATGRTTWVHDNVAKAPTA